MSACAWPNRKTPLVCAMLLRRTAGFTGQSLTHSSTNTQAIRKPHLPTYLPTASYCSSPSLWLLLTARTIPMTKKNRYCAGAVSRRRANSRPQPLLQLSIPPCGLGSHCVWGENGVERFFLTDQTTHGHAVRLGAYYSTDLPTCNCNCRSSRSRSSSSSW